MAVVTCVFIILRPQCGSGEDQDIVGFGGGVSHEMSFYASSAVINRFADSINAVFEDAANEAFVIKTEMQIKNPLCKTNTILFAIPPI
jgi:hypothetical protein